MDVNLAEGRKWSCHAKRFWPGRTCKDSLRETGNICWDVDCVLTETDRLKGTQDNFWKRAKVHVLYVGGKKSLTKS